MASVATNLYGRWGSKPFRGDAEMAKGDTHRLVVTVVDDDGAALDLTGASVDWALARTADCTPDVSKSTADGISLTNAAAGQFTVTLDPADTSSLDAGSYYHEAEVTDSASNVATVLIGRLTLREDAA